MKKLLTVLVAMTVVAGLGPSQAAAHGPRGGSPGFHSGRFAGSSARTGPGFAHKGFIHKRSVPERSVLLQPPVDPWRFWPPSAASRHRVHRRPDFPFTGFVGAPSLVVVTPALADAYDASPVAYGQAPLYAPPQVAAVSAPAALPMPTLIDFPTGWYQLRGDGVTTPYSWVWIPKPPVAPAALAEASAPASEPAPAGPPAAAQERGPAYHWTNGGGVTTWTNRLDRVPKRFRDQAAASID